MVTHNEEFQTDILELLLLLTAAGNNTTHIPILHFSCTQDLHNTLTGQEKSSTVPKYSQTINLLIPKEIQQYCTHARLTSPLPDHASISGTMSRRATVGMGTLRVTDPGNSRLYASQWLRTPGRAQPQGRPAVRGLQERCSQASGRSPSQSCLPRWPRQQCPPRLAGPAQGRGLDKSESNIGPTGVF